VTFDNNVVVTIVDPDDPTNPTTVIMPDAGDPTTYRVEVGSDGWVYQWAYNSGYSVWAIDPDDPTNPTRIDSPGALDSVVGVDGADVLISGRGVILVHHDDPANPVDLDTTGGIYDAPVVGPDGTIYVTSYSDILDAEDNVVGYTTHVYAIDPADPTNRTVVDLDGRALGGVVLSDDGTVYQRVVNHLGDEVRVYAIDPSGTSFTGPLVEADTFDGSAEVSSADGLGYVTVSNPDGTTTVTVLGVPSLIAP
jgi:hypothetical protein